MTNLFSRHGPTQQVPSSTMKKRKLLFLPPTWSTAKTCGHTSTQITRIVISSVTIAQDTGKSRATDQTSPTCDKDVTTIVNKPIINIGHHHTYIHDVQHTYYFCLKHISNLMITTSHHHYVHIRQQACQICHKLSDDFANITEHVKHNHDIQLSCQ